MFEKVSKHIKHARWNWIRHCAVCNSSFPPIEWLCKDCFHQLKRLYIPAFYMTRMQSNFRHLRLVDWTNSNHRFIQTLLNRLKGTEGSYFFSLLAFEFFTRIIQLPSVVRDRPFVFVPCPSRRIMHPLWSFLSSSMFLHSFSLPFQNALNKNKKIVKDHSYYWAEALQKFTKSPIYSVLSQSSSHSSQKRKNLLERKQKTFFAEDINTLPKDHQIVFVDDVVTSGATAMSVYKALGQPKQFMIWSIFWRKL